MKQILEGKKTYIGLAITLFGLFGLVAYITPEETERVFTMLFEFVGIGIAVYGRIVAKPKV